ncbi:S8 family serine peptidase [Bacillus sp. FSL M8-0052]|nr:MULTISPECIES: S8 family peptidase [Bacillus]MDU0069655.1 S8 family serine peptidase [Bacillus sp. IG6]MED8017366.1 S8 family serine peptidase [Bacillus glycinifermentans]WKB79634.1 S8 family serine peptidase [Bacillus glycinifermentans]
MSSRVHAEGQQHGSGVIVVYKNKSGQETALEKSESVDHQYKHIPAVAVTADKETVQDLKDDPDILYVEKNVSFTAADSTEFKVLSDETGEDSDSFEQWNLKPIQAEKAWSAGLTGKNVKVAVIDTGISAHDELTVSGGTSTVSYTSSYSDDNGHGTHVAGIIGAKHNDYGIDGIAPGVQLYAIKALDQNGTGDLESILKGIDWSIEHGVNVINMSLGTSTDSQILHDAVDKAYQKGILLVAASGNDGNGHPVDYPAAYSSVIAVSATDEENGIAGFSNTGADVEFSAPGTSIISTYLHQQFAAGSGTSQATPHVTGMLALLKQLYPNETSAGLRQQLQQNVNDLGDAGRDQLFGYGLIQYKETQSAALAAARKAVENAEKTKLQSDIDAARKLVGKLPDTSEKNELQKRLDNVQSERNLADAKRKVSLAEKYKTEKSVGEAQSAINKLPGGIAKTNLQKRLDNVKRYMAKAIDKAAEKVTKAEKKKNKTNLKDAEKAVSQLPSGSAKTKLQKRLNAVRTSLIKTAKQAVSSAEKAANDSNIAKAQKAVNELDSGKDKTSLQKKLDAAKKKAAASYSKKVKSAEAKVKAAEKSKTKKAKASAQSAVKQLKASSAKTKLMKRLNAIKVK